ncbi:MAG: penicillin-insensitive murein endopeptidase [Thioalkalispiraceae bacterium]
MYPRLLLIILSCCLSSYSLSTESTCYGSTKQGRLEQGVKLPSSGINFVSYSTLARFIGRTYVHSSVRDIVVSAYADLDRQLPEKKFKYAETGFKQGGEFSPHKTHQNGLSVDFMVPVMNQENESVHLPTHMLNRYGYDIEFDQQGRYQDLRIDYEAMAAHLVALDKQAKARRVTLWRVIFDPKLSPQLLMTKYAEYIKNNITLSKKRSWVRHDEHYHVDFDLPCKK